MREGGRKGGEGMNIHSNAWMCGMEVLLPLSLPSLSFPHPLPLQGKSLQYLSLPSLPPSLPTWSIWHMVLSMTEGPANPIRASATATRTSACMA
jgi:hypothetical protein